jgi:hypothetical protein
MLQFILNNLVTIATGATTALIAFMIYTTTNKTFQSRGKFRGKEEALFITLGTISITGLLTPSIQNIWTNALSVISGLQLLGVTIVLGMIVVNESVNDWKHFDIKSITMHILGITLFLFGKTIYYIPLV